MTRRKKEIDVPSPFDGAIAAMFGVDPPKPSDYGPRKEVDEFYITRTKPLEEWTPEEVAQANRENALNRTRLIAEHEKEMASLTPKSREVRIYEISCLRCGNLQEWVWMPLNKEEIDRINRREIGDPTVMFNGNAIFDKLKRHSSLLRGHHLRLRMKSTTETYLSKPADPSP